MPLRRSQPSPQPEALFDPAKIDVVALAPDSSHVDLVIVAEAPWTGSDTQIRSLQEKIHAYVGFAADGQLAATHPEAASLPWRIVISGPAGAPDPRTAEVLEATRGPVQRYGGDLIHQR